MTPYVMLNLVQHLTASLFLSFSADRSWTKFRMTDACLVSLSHAELVSASHREPFLSFSADRSWTKFRMTDGERLTFNGKPSGRRGHKVLCIMSCWTRFSISPRAFLVRGEWLSFVIFQTFFCYQRTPIIWNTHVSDFWSVEKIWITYVSRYKRCL